MHYITYITEIGSACEQGILTSSVPKQLCLISLPKFANCKQTLFPSYYWVKRNTEHWTRHSKTHLGFWEKHMDAPILERL